MTLLSLLACTALAAGDTPALTVKQVEGVWRVQVGAGGRVLVSSPEEGLWSIAADWQDDWPAEWHHAHPASMEQAGPWTVLRGTVDVPQGSWHVSDAYRPEGRAIKCIRRFEWHGEMPAEHCTLSVRFDTPAVGPGIVMPGIQYHGNPSGAKSGRTPVYTGKAGEEAIYEEHRFPMPFVSFEWQAEGAWQGAALHSLPSPVPCGNLPDQWWSLGCIAREGATELLLLSGPCASNGQRSVVKAIQPGFLPYENAYLNVPPGAIIEKTFYLEAYPVEREGAGFQRPVETSLALFSPYDLSELPSFGEIVEAKARFAQTRWFEKDGAGGFQKFPDKHFFVFGWCGQAAACAYAFQALQGIVDVPQGKHMVQTSLDTLAKAEFYDGGFRTWFNADTGEWSRHEPLSQGQGMLNFANAIRLGRENGYDTAQWETFLKKACTFHAARILSAEWNPKSTDEGFFIAPLCAGYALFGEEDFRKAAEKAGRAYAERHLNMREPYWGGTLDASCEDKEGAFAALQGFVALYEMNPKPEYLEWAQHACDVALTYTVVWDIDLPAGRLRDHGFKTRGWTAVSVQNMHIDVYGVLIAPDVYRLGQHAKRSDLQQLALVMYRSCGQLLDPYGSQGEQPQHTNYAQRGKMDSAFGVRGGYVEDWTVFWITAHFLNAAAQLRELGVDVSAD